MLTKKDKVTELILYITYGLIALAGLTLVVLHIIGMNLENLSNALRTADESFAKTMKMSFLVFGSILIVLAGILSAITLAVNGQKAELIEEKKARRRQRLALEEDSGELE
ncbi:MAG: hypothetical protein WC275_03775 [Bacilli bacterium]|jgi:signal transduction histidine kinase